MKYLFRLDVRSIVISDTVPLMYLRKCGMKGHFDLLIQHVVSLHTHWLAGQVCASFKRIDLRHQMSIAVDYYFSKVKSTTQCNPMLKYFYSGTTFMRPCYMLHFRGFQYIFCRYGLLSTTRLHSIVLHVNNNINKGPVIKSSSDGRQACKEDRYVCLWKS